MITNYSFVSKQRIFFSVTFIFLLANFVFGLDISANQQKGNDPEKKSIEPVRITEPIRIDGLLDEGSWKASKIATDFIQYMPFNGRASGFISEVRVLYDNTAIYVGAIMLDPNPDSIYRELGERDADRMLNADNFSVEISPYNDGVNGFRFKVSASGVQSDSRVELREPGQGGGGGGGGLSGGGGGQPGGGPGGGGSGRQDNWDAVWESNVTITDSGWIAEIRIPYSALRFPKEKIQTWGINFWREVRRNREQSSWNYVDRNIGSTVNHLGELSNISEIKPPLRLSLTPYISGYLEKISDKSKPTFSYNGGLDVKYGINESFTVDATLVPDFGQVQSDDKILNLTPYEVKYNEKRPFFMEGTELFSKGDIFYSRRVGTKPRSYYEVYDTLSSNQIVSSNPAEAELINATKLSGRTKSGLGIGIFNAMTKEMFATITDTLSGETRTFKTEPFTNFNMIVLDQSLKNNSFLSFANTNVWRRAEKDARYYTANVTATDMNLQSKSRLYSFSAKAALSQKYYNDDPSAFGHAFYLRAGKTGGAFRAEYTITGLSDTYDPNDMGYLRRNNELNNEFQVSYYINQPVWRILSSRNSIQYSFTQLYNPRVFTQTQIELSSFTTFRSYNSVNLRFELSPMGSNDYYEPRVPGRFYHKGSQLMTMLWFDSNRNKKFSINLRGNFALIWSDYDQKDFSLSVGPALRLSNKFSLNHQLSYMTSNNDLGFVTENNSADIVFGKRDNKTVSNTFSAGYIFSANSYISFRLRHYWSLADYDGNFYLLKKDGRLDKTDLYSGNPDSNFNSFNIDMVYTWRFAPGSEMTFVWKNAIYSNGSTIYHAFGENLNNMFDSPQTNSLSLKILYYLDYQYLKKRN